LSWALRSTRDLGIDDCAGGFIERIRLNWRIGTEERFTSFPCEENHGVTQFELPVGRVELWVTPQCVRTRLEPDSDMFVTPPPIVRDVTVGEAVTLDAVLLVVKIDDCSTVSCICGHPCVCAPAQAAGPRLATDSGTKHPDPRGEEP
jgi:hypothetical protein